MNDVVKLVMNKTQAEGDDYLRTLSDRNDSALSLAGRENNAGAFKMKDKQPSATMLPPDGRRYTCRWLDDSITIHSDGNVSCGLDDPHARRSFGNVYEQPLVDLYRNPEFDRVRQQLWDGRRCRGCSLYQLASDTEAPAPQARPNLPTKIVVETTVKCNLRCNNGACIPNNEPGLLTRDKSNLDFSKFRGVIDQLANELNTVYFFNYGDPFIHPHAEDMLLYLRAVCPDARVITSTNGIPLARAERARKVVKSQVDCITFTIGGVRQGSYEKYHMNGQVGLALQGLQNTCESKKDFSFQKPIIVWRYLVFRWNDSEREIDAAIALSELYGVDQFCLFMTHIPADASSYRLAPGSPLHDKYRRYIDFVHGFECAMPDPDGFYHSEDIPGLGSARWSCWRAIVRRRRDGHCLRLRISTNRPSSFDRTQYCIVQTSWISMRVRLKPLEWQEVAILVPWELRDIDEFEIELLNEDCWFPIEETKSSDLRCLGVLLGEDPGSSASDQDASRYLASQGFEVLTAAEQHRLKSYGTRTSPPRLANNGGLSPLSSENNQQA